jgi:TRAP-type C4-dicarboxylate transport system substrate-binding protein
VATSAEGSAGHCIGRVQPGGDQAARRRAQLNEAAVADLQKKGLTINRPAPDTFRAALRQANFYAQWKGRFGNEAWSLLESYTGKLA